MKKFFLVVSALIVLHGLVHAMDENIKNLQPNDLHVMDKYVGYIHKATVGGMLCIHRPLDKYIRFKVIDYINGNREYLYQLFIGEMGDEGPVTHDGPLVPDHIKKELDTMLVIKNTKS